MIERPMMTCTACGRWWSGEPINGHVQTCACGGELQVVDMAKHIASLPMKQDTPEEIAQKKLQEERSAAAKAEREAKK